MSQDVSKMSRDELEVRSRRMESELNVLGSRAAANPEGFKKGMDRRNKEYQDIQKRLRDLDKAKVVADPEGTAHTFSDAEGNFAGNADTAHVGGIGVKNSNTDPEGVRAKQRKQLEKAGVEEPEKVPDSQLANLDPDPSSDPAPKPQKK